MKQLSHHTHKSLKAKRTFQIFAEQLKSPYNVGSLFRLADALGIQKIYFGGDTPLPPNRKVTKTSRSTEKYVLFEQRTNANKLITELKANKHIVIALELCDQSVPLNTISLEKNRPICLILGDEKMGVSQDSLEAADLVIHIPMLGENSSMNVIQACSIAAYTLINQ